MWLYSSTCNPATNEAHDTTRIHSKNAGLAHPMVLSLYGLKLLVTNLCTRLDLPTPIAAKPQRNRQHNRETECIQGYRRRGQSILGDNRVQAFCTKLAQRKSSQISFNSNLSTIEHCQTRSKYLT